MIPGPFVTGIVVAMSFSDGSMVRLDMDGGEVIMNRDERNGTWVEISGFTEYRQTVYKPEQVSIEDGSVVDVQDPAPPTGGATG